VGQIKEYAASAKNWFDRNFTFKGMAAATLAAAKVIPDAFGRKDFWSVHLTSIWHFLSAHSTPSVILACALLIWLDNRRVIKNRGPKPYDERTLRGRTLKLRDNIKAFLESVGPPPKDRMLGESQVGYLRRVDTVASKRASQLVHGYELRFAESVTRTYHEYGELGWNDTELMDVIQRPFKNEKCYQLLIDALGRLAEKTEILDADPTLTWTDINNMTADDMRKKLTESKEFERNVNALPPQEWR